MTKRTCLFTWTLSLRQKYKHELGIQNCCLYLADSTCLMFRGKQQPSELGPPGREEQAAFGPECWLPHCESGLRKRPQQCSPRQCQWCSANAPQPSETDRFLITKEACVSAQTDTLLGLFSQAKCKFFLNLRRLNPDPSVCQWPDHTRIPLPWGC